MTMSAEFLLLDSKKSANPAQVWSRVTGSSQGAFVLRRGRRVPVPAPSLGELVDWWTLPRRRGLRSLRNPFPAARAARILNLFATTASRGSLFSVDPGSLLGLGPSRISGSKAPGAQAEVLTGYFEKPCSRAKASTASFP